MQDVDALLDFWFGELSDGLADDAHRQRWFAPDRAFDEVCEQRFAPLLDRAQRGELDGWQTTPRGRLGFIVLCDQMPRNVHRGRSQAYAWDGLALAAAKAGIREKQDVELGWDERCFFYMPFEHSEDLIDQHTAVGLFSALRDESPGEIRELTGNYLRYAHQHRDIVQRFGRFPHRNAVLGRTSSDAEGAFVAGSDGFGQNV